MSALLVCCSQDQSYNATNHRGLSLEHANPGAGIFGPTGFVSCREGWATMAVPQAGDLPPGTEVVTMPLSWVGTHGLASVALVD
jgi:hypothetical protein